jgi:hypothetical protein
VNIPEEGEARREFVDVHPALDALLDVSDAVGQRERQFLRRRRAGFADVVAADRDRIPFRHVLRAPLDHIHADLHVRAGRADPLLLRDELLQHIRLDRAAQLGRLQALLLADRHVHRQKDDGRRVDRHGGRDLVERNAAKQEFHVLERRNGDALAAHLAERHRVIGVVSHERRHVERG